jgi:hypothetical protein
MKLPVIKAMQLQNVENAELPQRDSAFDAISSSDNAFETRK